GGLARSRAGAVSARSAKAAEAEWNLRPDQAAAFAHATAAGNLKLIEGRAGTGKSFTLAAIRDAHERDGKRVVGLAPTNAVAQDLAADGFSEASTVHAALFRLKNGRTSWDRRTVVVVDEAAMLDTRVTGELLAAARQAGAKVVLAGDDRQLASIERGGLFAELRQRHGAAEITEVTRQKVDWQRQAARDLAEGRFAEAVDAFDKAGAITWTNTQDEARGTLVAAWTRDAEARPGASRFVFAYTNHDVDALNAELRQVRRARGELTGPDVRLETKHGAADFAVGDRVQFTGTDKKLRIYNGNVGTITGLDPSTGQLTARLDAASGAGREVTFSPAEFEGFRHGYAGTIYKGQGKTLDRTYLYHTEHWRAAASYVALTRQRESAEVFVARETARDAGQLARQMGRGEVRAASIAWVAHEELATTRVARQAEAAAPPPRPATRGKAAEADPDKAYWQSVGDKSGKARDEDALRAKVRDALTARQRMNAKAEAEKPEAALSPDGRLVLAALHSKIDREFAGSAEDRAALKADAARQLIAKEEREGPVVLSEAQRRLATGPAADREQLRRELQTLDRSALAEAARADQVGVVWDTRPMTVQDAARLVSRDYAAAADRAAELRKAAAAAEKSIEYNERVQRAGQEQGNRRWQRMGFVRQVMHKSGTRRDPALAVNEAGEGHAVDELLKLDVRRAELAQQVPQAEKAEAAAFRQAEPAAKADLVQRQERAGLAREVLAEQRQQEATHERQLERSRHRSRGMER
ncbi:MAG TPA: AAA family ATPase, partial [Pseudolabrys sp.]